MESCIFYFALPLLLLHSLTLSSSAPIFNLTTDQHTLLTFKSAIINDGGILSKNWSTSVSVCHWIGVSCGIKHRNRVTALNLSQFDLQGTLSPHLGNLTFLRSLDVSFNSFRGFIPPWFGALPRLRHLRMNNNTFSGGIPPALFNISTLQTLDIAFNNFVGNLPKEMGNFSSSLEIINLAGNQITGSIPNGMLNISSLVGINMGLNRLSGELPKDDICGPKLKKMYLSANQLSGEIPKSISKCKELEDLRLAVNHFNGNIPTEIGSLDKLTILSLWSNDFTGTIPKQIEYLTSMEALNIGDNNFVGNIPQELGNLSMLEELSIDNAYLMGNIPSSIFNISSLARLDFSYNFLSGSYIPKENFHIQSNLQQLFLMNNKFTGTVLKQTGNLTFLRLLSLADNNLRGELPDEIGNLAYLEGFSVFNNSLSGSIPSSIFNISTLRFLHLSFNQFWGSLPSNMGLSLFNLEKLALSMNSLSGEFPSSISNASKITLLEMDGNSLSGSIPNFGNLRYLEALRIQGNNLTGANELEFLSSLTSCLHLAQLLVDNNPLNGILPTSVGNFSTSLVEFSADDCGIHGVIPPEIGKLKRLQILSLSGNQLQGSIPNQLCQLRSLGDLYLNDNKLTGPIPECFGDLAKSLRVISLGSNKLNSTLPTNFWNLRYLVNLSLPSNHLSGQISSQIADLKEINYIDLSSNQFSGDIPGSIDGCLSLENLDLSNNMFRGTIPQSLGKARGLTNLDLSRNDISGSIPESLEDLPFLRKLNVSHNKLEGKIPDNLTAQLYFDDNSALCGAPRFHVPPCPGSRSVSVSRLMKYIVPIFISSIILVSIIAMLIRRRKREIMPTLSNVTPDITEWRRVSYVELSRGTSSFSETNLLGRGSFGSVFKGTLADSLNVAIKVFNLQLEQAAKNFATESAILSTIRHRNLVRVIGCCTNTEFKALVLEYMENGSLYKWLYSENYCLDLLQRLKIAIDVASDLEHLHYRHTFPVVHCDIKPNNVLLDEDMTARICDFGMSKLFDDGEVVIHTTTLATIGYAAPEYGSEGKVSTSGDVYSYGIMLLEMFTGKKPMDDIFDENMSIKEWVSRAMQENAVREVVAPTLLSREDDEHLHEKIRCLSYIFDLAMKCLTSSADERINMMQVMGTLHKIKALF